jgi:DNA adenine methylase
MINSVIATSGGKSVVRHEVLKYLPKHTAYIEPFCGAIWFLLGKKRSTVEIINDMDSNITTFFRVLRDNPEELTGLINLVVYSRDSFEEFSRMSPVNDMQKALRFYVLNRMAFSAKRDSRASFGYGILRAPAMHRRYEIFLPVIERLQNVTVENLDFREILTRYDSEDVVFLCDPPYYGAESHYGNLEFPSFVHKDHVDLCEMLKNIKGKFLLTYGEHPVIRELYKGFDVKTIDRVENVALTKDTNERKERIKAVDLLIANYKLSEYDCPLFAGDFSYGCSDEGHNQNSNGGSIMETKEFSVKMGDEPGKVTDDDSKVDTGEAATGEDAAAATDAAAGTATTGDESAAGEDGGEEALDYTAEEIAEIKTDVRAEMIDSFSDKLTDHEKCVNFVLETFNSYQTNMLVAAEGSKERTAQVVKDIKTIADSPSNAKKVDYLVDVAEYVFFGG